MKPKIETLISKIDLMVLGLVLEKPMHGYEINQIISSDHMQSWLDISRTSVYYSLTRLKKQGLITEVVEKQYNKPDRSIYRVTEYGRKLFFDSLARLLAEQDKVFLDYNIGLFFINKFTREKAFEVLEKRKRYLKKWRAGLQEQLKLAKNGDVYPTTLKLVVGHTLAFAEHETAWLETFIESENNPPNRQGTASVFSLSGDLSKVQLADVMRTITTGVRTGTLYLKRGASLVTITFIKGEVRYAASSSGLLGKGDDQLADNAIPDRILKPFKWPDGSFVFTPDLLVEEGGVALKVDSCSLIFAGCRVVDDWNRIRKVIPSSDTVYELDESRKVLDKINLNSDEEAVLSQINGMRNIEKLAAATSLSIFDVSRVLYTFSICGLVVTANKDKGELFDLLKFLSDALFERLIAIRAEKIAVQVEEDLNKLASEQKMSFMLREFKLIDSIDVPQDIHEFVKLAKEFYFMQLGFIRSQLGTRFIQHVLESVISQLTPEMHDIYTRHGFDKYKLEG